MKQITSYKIALVLVAGLLIATTLLWTKWSINRQEEEKVTNIQHQDFDEHHYNLILVDTFLHLVNGAYQKNVTTQVIQNKLHVAIQNAGALTKDFFNGNDHLLDLDEHDYGFDINYDAGANKIEAAFVIKNNSVPVPNDVMIKLMDKNYNK